MISTDSLYSLGKYKDCQRKLELKLNEQDGKSLRDKIILINNRLACQLKSAASNEELDKIRQDYLLLWKLDAGLPESHDSHVTCSAAVICNLMSCYVRVWLVTGQISLIYEAIDKFKDIRTKINSEDNVIVTKLYQIKKLLKVINEEKDIGQFMINNNNQSCSDVKYYRAHQLYMEGDYSQCVQAINNNRPIDDFMLTLLANCHVKMGHYQLALHYYKRCLSLTTGCLHQLVTRNICTTYQLIDNTTAELSLRDLYVQLLKNSQVASPTSNKLLLYQNITGNITNHVTATDHWMEAAYTAIKRCLTLKELKY
jgi:tetratricopeptide (TPR) repeat protein